ncbi:uncharacterized protein MELLADRAFT_103149 [Melampsora larici-populina 98AG31]|uniref:Uncharacterized protein n=1 Tax=Melampsora larici-populina (strain 98AG31 / pathotype 3-4-7) TaxID=747676 RepID=F4RAP9_MELLP|nr:uncharacterized protein MELLADRAFT_103149 [Melampsora larici-populina 98AG31]EGG10519.1 hypothetical protein MELLADRAFT_103149 [Melampsora larici-populina 98AG31]
MDSEEFQRQIDETLRKEEGGGKGKEVEEVSEGRKGDEEERERDQNEGGEVRDEGEGRLTEDLAPGPSGQEELPTTRQSKRKKAPPKPFPPPSNPKPVGQKKGKKIKLADGKSQVVEAEGRKKSQPAGVIKPGSGRPTTKQQPTPKRKTTQNAESEDKEQHKESSGEEEEDQQEPNAGELWCGKTVQRDEHSRVRTVGGIVLGDKSELEQPVEDQNIAEPSVTDVVASQLEEAINAAFAAGDRKLYDNLSKQKEECVQSWSGRYRDGRHQYSKSNYRETCGERHDPSKRRLVLR